MENRNMVNNEELGQMIEMVRTAYVKVYGEAKWISLTNQQKHDVVMILCEDLLNAFRAMH